MKLKTRTNQPVYYKLPVSSNMEQLSDGLLNSLKVGDVVQKKTGEQKHCYIVSYKEEKKGICLTYVDGSGYMETLSYDYTGGRWVFNSKDVTQAQDVTKAQSGTINKVLGLDSNGKLVKGDVSGGTQLYQHRFVGPQQMSEVVIINNSNTAIDYTTFLQSIQTALKARVGFVNIFSATQTGQYTFTCNTLTATAGSTTNVNLEGLTDQITTL